MDPEVDDVIEGDLLVPVQDLDGPGDGGPIQDASRKDLVGR